MSVCLLTGGCSAIVGVDQGETQCQEDQWWDCQFRHRVAVSFLNEAGDQELNDIPLAIKLTPDVIDYQDFADDGADIRFVDGDTVLSHEIEVWNPGGESWLWVRVPRIEANSNNSFIHMYYEAEDAEAAQPLTDLDGVWPQEYELVYHFAEDPSEGPFRDSSGNARDAKAYGGVTSTTATLDGGPGGPVLELDGNEQTYVDAGLDNELESGPIDMLTLEMWFRSDQLSRQAHLIHKEGACRGWRLYTFPDDFLQGRAGNECPDEQYALATVSLMTERWYHVTLTVDRRQANSVEVCVELRDRNAGEIVRDRQCDVQTDLNGDGIAGAPVLIGANYALEQNFDGRIDELRVLRGEPESAVLDAQFRATIGDFTDIGSPETIIPYLL